MKKTSIRIAISESIGEVSAEIFEPKNMTAMLVLAHGAGAGMNHAFMVNLSEALGDAGIGTLRYNFPYMENGKKRPDVPNVATKTVERVLEKANELFSDTLLFAGGKSFGGRMTSTLLSKTRLDFIKGVVFAGFPLHAAGSPGITRGEHLASVRPPMLFLQGTRDALAELALIKQVAKGLKKSTLVLFEGADHSFKAGKRDLIPELRDEIKKWMDKI